MILNTRLEKCLKEYDSIDADIKNRYDLKFEDIQNILEMIFNNPEINSNSIWEIITICYQVGFVLGRRSGVKND